MSDKVQNLRNVPKLRFSDFNNSWEVKTLNDVCGKKNLVRGPFGGALKKADFVKEGIKIYEQKNAIYSTYDLGNYFIDENKFESMRRFEVIENDFIVSCSGTIGKIYRITKTAPKGIINQALLKIRIKNNVNHSFFEHYFKSSQIQRKIVITQGGAIQNIVGMDTLRKVKLNIPELNEQLKIGCFLDVIDLKIELIEKKIENLKLFKKGFITNSLKEIENGSRKMKLNDISDKMFSGGTPKSTESRYYNGEINFLTISDITSSGKMLNKVSRTITSEGLNNSSAKIVKKGNLIYTMYATIAVPIITNIDVAIPQSVMAINLNEKVNIDFIYYQLDSMTELVRSKYTETGTQGNINSQIVRNLYLIIPDIKIQKEIVEKFNTIEYKINSLDSQLQTLKEFKKGLLQQMFI